MEYHRFCCKTSLVGSGTILERKMPIKQQYLVLLQFTRQKWLPNSIMNDIF